MNGSSPENSVTIRAEPIDAIRCRFLVNRALDPGRWAYFGDRGAAAGSPLAERLLAIEGVTAVLIAHDSATITRERPSGIPVIGPALFRLRRLMGDARAGADSWPRLGKQVGEAIRAHLATGDPAVSEAAHAAMPSSSVLADRVRQVLDEHVNPVVAGHGGRVELLEMKDNVAYLRMGGGCQGCGLADVTLRHGVEAILRDLVPELGPIFDLTNHAAGTAPYAPGRSGRSPLANRG
ncbi:NifU family protein [Tautonia marina]|uniref:NifU family protein n=1 Tax=Tautonia marina TaxID=2653855 RepID=UPI0012609765|nr:NifU family protein [Tautonia marina]